MRVAQRLPPEIVASRHYRLLDAHSKQIRILSLFAGQPDDTISASLQPVSLLDQPKYEALSYVWGRHNDLEIIQLDGSSIVITKNLWIALKHLRYTDRTRYTWIDAICVNQRDTSERNSQVLLMQEVYSTCSRCLIWLGEEDEYTHRAMSIVNSWAAHEDIHLSETSGFDEFGARALEAFIERPWWSRIWTVQESVIPEEVLMICGPHSLPWTDFKKALDVLTNHGSTCCTEMERAKRRALFRFIHAVAEIQNNRPYLEGLKKTRLLYLLSLFRNRESSDPRDKVFALLGLSFDSQSRTIYPDYEANVEDPFIAVAQNCITQDNTLEILCFTMIGPRAINSKSKFIERTKMTSRLPSWVPDWRQNSDKWSTRSPTRLEWPSSSRLYMKYLSFNVYSSHPAKVSFHSFMKNEVLEARGLAFDTILLIAGEIMSFKSPQASLKQWYRTLTAQSREVYSMSPGIDEAFVRTILLDLMDEGKSIRRLLQRDVHTWKTWLTFLSEKAPESQTPLESSIGMLRSLQMAIRGRRLFVTSAGYMGIGGLAMKEGDIVYILAGSRWPLILRRRTLKTPTQKSLVRYHGLVGICYVHGIMDGDFMEAFQHQMQPIYLV